jgi:hypothetical protein
MGFSHHMLRNTPTQQQHCCLSVLLMQPPVSSPGSAAWYSRCIMVGCNACHGRARDPVADACVCKLWQVAMELAGPS